MNKQSNNLYDSFLNTVRDLFREIDQTIEKIVQETVDDVEKAYQKD